MKKIKIGKPRTKRFTSLVRGKYRHFKGGLYKVIGIAQHTETNEELVIYQALSGDRKLWASSEKMFLQKIKIGGKKILRFKYIGK
jgi:hypothetical protein